MSKGLLFTAGALAALVGSGCGPRDFCARVKCGAGKACEPSTGLCIALDPVPDNTGDGGADAGVDTVVDAGVACAPACDGGLPVCDRSTGQCVECLANSDCRCPNPSCNVGTRTCEAEAAPSPPGSGDTCATAAPILLPRCGSQVVSFEVDTSLAGDDGSGSCSAAGASSGRDFVYSITLTEPKDLTVTATPLGSPTDSLVYVRKSPCAAGVELACSDELASPEQVKLKSLAPGVYYLFVDSYSAAGAGPTQVSVELSSPTAPSNETCATAADINFADGGSTAIFEVDTSTALDDASGTCNPAPASPEAVYQLSLSAARAISVTSRGIGDGGSAPVIYLRGPSCEAAAELACSAGGAFQRIRANELAPGEYFLFVEGTGPADAGLTEVTVKTSAPIPPPPNNTCAGPRLIVFPSGANSVSFTVDTSEATDDYQSSCNDEEDSPEVVFRLSLATAQLVEITSAPADGAMADPVLYLRSSPCGADGGDELACDDEYGSAESIVASLQAGEYFLFVEGYGSAGSGPTDVTVRVTP